MARRHSNMRSRRPHNSSCTAPCLPTCAGGQGPVAAAREFKEMVRTLHAAGIEVILDVVYNHTVEGEACAWRGCDGEHHHRPEKNNRGRLFGRR